MVSGCAHPSATYSVWLVGLPADEAGRFAQRLVRRVGCAVTIVPAFEDARVALLANHAPDVLVAPVRLGAFSGIHLAIIAYVGSPVPAVVIIDDPEAHHELDARHSDSHYLVRPVRAGELAGLIGRIARGHAQRRLARRIRAPRNVVLSLDGIDDSRVLEFSDGGMRLAVPAASSWRLPSVFDVSVGEHEVTVRQTWHRERFASTHVGLVVYQESPSCAHHWRELRASFSANFP